MSINLRSNVIYFPKILFPINQDFFYISLFAIDHIRSFYYIQRSIVESLVGAHAKFLESSRDIPGQSLGSHCADEFIRAMMKGSVDPTITSRHDARRILMYSHM